MRIVNIAVASCALIFPFVPHAIADPSVQNSVRAVGLQFHNFPSHTYNAILADYVPGEKLTWTVTTGSSIYHLIGPSLNVHVANDGSINVPYLDDSTTEHRSQWGAVVNGVALCAVTDEPSVAHGEPLYGQVTVENLGTKAFEMRNGCGPNMELALPEILDSSGHKVKEKFQIGQQVCSGTWPYSIPVKTTSRFIFNIRDLYDIDTPGTYKMVVHFPDFAGAAAWPKSRSPVASGIATFVVK